MVVEVFYKRQTPKIIQYSSYKNFDNQVFQTELNSELLKIDLNNADLFRVILRANNSNCVTKNLKKAIMKSSKLRNKYLRERTNEAKSIYNKQRNLCLIILRKNKRDYPTTKLLLIIEKFGKLQVLFSPKSLSIENAQH